MSTPQRLPVAKELDELLNDFDSKFGGFAQNVAKLAKLLTNSKENRTSWPFKGLGQLEHAANACSQYQQIPDFARFLASLKTVTNEFHKVFFVEFGKELRVLANESDLDFQAKEKTYLLGAMEVVPDLHRETVSLRYAQSLLMRDVPLEAKQVVSTVKNAEVELFANIPDPKSLSADFEMAVRVSLAREGFVKSGSLRGLLPQTFQEMQLIRQSNRSKHTAEYNRPQFVVELMTLVKSSENIEGKLGKEFRLETAVIDNSRNEAKSVFLPDKMNKGSGEGKYYQAINVIYKT